MAPRFRGDDERKTTPGWLIGLFGLFLCILATAGARADSGGIAQKAVICDACHGVAGIPANKQTPVIWGQHAGYIFIELRDMQSGARANPAMAGVLSGMTHSDMLALGEYFEAKPWPDLQQPRAPDDVTKKAEGMAASGQCTQCHLSGYVGASTVPRLAGQSTDYLRKTMTDFRTGARANNPWMTALLKTYSDADIDVLAKWLAGL